MTLADLIARVRSDANDAIVPYFWSDDQITGWLNDAQSEAAVRMRLIHEISDDSVCQITVTATAAVYPLHPALYEITHIEFLRTSAAHATALRLVSTEWLDSEIRNWRSHTGCPVYVVQDDTTIRLVPKPKDDGSIRLEGFRTPINVLEDTDDEPEIHAFHHVHLVQWALFKGFSIPDMETFDKTRAGSAEDAFTQYFGIRPDADLRRITREDVPQVVDSFWV